MTDCISLNIREHQKHFFSFQFGCSPFLAPLAEGQRAIVMALCPSCVHLFVRQSVRACVHKLFLQKTSQKLLTGFL